MFDISSGELGIIAVVALIVLGPERLPKAARVAGAMLRKARLAYSEVRDQVERELDAEELKQQMAAAKAGIDAVTKPLNDAVRETDSVLRDAEKAAKAELDDLAARATAATGPVADSAESPAESPLAATADSASGDAAPEPQLELPLPPSSEAVPTPVTPSEGTATAGPTTTETP